MLFSLLASKEKDSCCKNCVSTVLGSTSPFPTVVDALNRWWRRCITNLGDEMCYGRACHRSWDIAASKYLLIHLGPWTVMTMVMGSRP